MVQALEAEAAVLRTEVKLAQTLVLREELRSRRRVLRRLGYLTPDGLVTPKGELLPALQRTLMLMLQGAACHALTCYAAVTLLSPHRPGVRPDTSMLQHASRRRLTRATGTARCFHQWSLSPSAQVRRVCRSA